MAINDIEFTEFASARWMTLVRAAVLLGSSVAEAEDLAQVTLTKCYLSWSRVQRADNIEAYVSRILLNSFRASRRRRWWGEEPTAEIPEAPQPTSRDVETELMVQSALKQLSQGQREVVVLRLLMNLSEQQTADALSVAVGTVKSRLARATAQLSSDPTLSDLRSTGG